MVKYIVFISSLFIAGCATNSRKILSELKQTVKEQKFEKAVATINSPTFLNDEKNALLKELESGRVFFISKNYKEALVHFDRAKELSEKLFTIRISKKILSSIVNDNSDNYYGTHFELSLIRYYQAITHVMLGENAKAKNILIEWDSYLSSLKATTGGEVTFKDDLLAKIFGANIHESLGEFKVATDLYKSAKNLILKNYNIYPSFNAKFDEFKSHFSEFSKMPVDLVEKNYVAKTDLQVNLLEYLNQKISQITHKSVDNCHFIIEENYIEEKYADVFDIPLPFNLSSATFDSGFIPFSLRVMGSASGLVPHIYFEIPKIHPPTTPKKLSLIIEKEIPNKPNEVIQTLLLNTINPNSEIAFQALEEKLFAIQTSTGLRVAGKHITALLSSYLLYRQSNKQNNNDFFAIALASLSYKAATSLIASSESADLRSWQLLPENIRIASAKLPAGDYVIKILHETEAPTTIGKIHVDDSNQFFNFSF